MTVPRRGVFRRQPDVLAALEPLAAVGSGLSALGQPVPTLSGGEAQRLKLAGHLAKAKTGGRARPVRDPTTAAPCSCSTNPPPDCTSTTSRTLLRAFRQLLADGHSLVVIEHNLDVIAAADWIIDLGPEGGAAGGEIVCTPARPRQIAAAHSQPYRRGAARATTRRHTPCSASRRRCRRRAASPLVDGRTRSRSCTRANTTCKNVDSGIPRDRFTVITGVSGSGKSTVAFDILFTEGQRRYLESLNAYARQFVQPARAPDVDAIFGIPPTVAIEQRTSRGGRKSTVATLTEIYHFLRLLFVKLGTQYCPDCDVPIEPQNRGVHRWRASAATHRGKRITLLAPLVSARKGYYTELARWAAARALTTCASTASCCPRTAGRGWTATASTTSSCRWAKITCRAATERTLRELCCGARWNSARAWCSVQSPAGSRAQLFSTRRACPGCGRSFDGAGPAPVLLQLPARLVRTLLRHRPQAAGLRRGAERRGDLVDRLVGGRDAACPACDGQRLNPEALAVRFHDRSIAEYTG